MKIYYIRYEGSEDDENWETLSLLADIPTYAPVVSSFRFTRYVEVLNGDEKVIYHGERTEDKIVWHLVNPPRNPFLA